MSQWVNFCPLLTMVTSRREDERQEAHDKLLPKFLMSMAIQVCVGVVSVIGGSMLTLQIVSYRVEKAEQAIEAIRQRQFKNEDRIGKTEADMAVVAERHRLEEIINQRDERPNRRK